MPAETIALRVSASKMQIIYTVCERLQATARSYKVTTKYKLIITRPQAIAAEVYKGVTMKTLDLQSTHEGADVIIPSQLVDAALQGSQNFRVINDDTDVFIQLIHYADTLLQKVLIVQHDHDKK